MRTLAIIISVIIAVAIAITSSVWLGILVAFACAVYQLILSYGRSGHGSERRTVQGALALDIVRSGVFLIPLGGALLNGFWLVALATVVVYGVNTFMS